MRVGSLVIADVLVDDSVTKTLSSYRESTRRDLFEIARSDSCSDMIGVWDERTIDQVRLAAGLEALQRDTDNGLLTFDIAWALARLGQVDEAIRVLDGLKQAGAPGCYEDVWWENPDFVAGWILAATGRDHEAIMKYHQAIAHPRLAERGPILAQLAATYHREGQFSEAVRYYREAIEDLCSPPPWESKEGWLKSNQSLVDLLEELAALASSSRPYPSDIEMSEQGVLDQRARSSQ